MILGFQEQFIPKILDGSKIHTLREGERWRKDMSIQFYGNVRTLEMYKFREDGVCTGVQRVFMTYDWILEISINGRELIKNDGFESEYKFIDFFFYKKGKKITDEATRQLVHWTDFRY